MVLKTLKTTNNLRYIAVFVAIVSLLMPFFLIGGSSMDEIWNFQYARRLLYGYVPYKDFSLAVLPLSAQINAILLYVFSDNLIIMRFTGIAISAITGTIIFAICHNLRIAAPITMFALSLFVFNVSILPANNYSWYAVMFLSLALLVELTKLGGQNSNAECLHDFISGCLLGLTTISKHNVGIITLVGVILYLTICRPCKLEERSPKPHAAVNVAQRIMLSIFCIIAGWGIPVMAELIYLYKTDAIGVFVKYNIKGVSSIINTIYIPYSTLLLDNYGFAFMLLVIILPIILIAVLLKGAYFTTSAKDRHIHIIVSIYSLANFSMVFPTADLAHFLFAFPLSVVAIALLLKNCKITKMIQVLTLLFVLIIVTNSFTYFIKLQSMLRNRPDLQIRHYSHIPFASDINGNIKDVVNFVVTAESSGKQAYILDFRAALYLIPLDKFDYESEALALKGSDPYGENKTIRMLSRSNNLVVLIRRRDVEPNWLEQKELATYVRNNMKFVACVGDLDVFEK